MRQTLALFMICLITTTPVARADIWGGDVVVLTQILVNALQQLAQLKSIVSSGKDQLGLMRDINRGINDSLNLIRTISPNSHPGIYENWDKVSTAMTQLESIYGIVIQSNDARVQRDTDESVAEAVALNNSIYKYTETIDAIGEMIKAESHAVSPGGAAKLTAQSLGVMLHIQNEMLRTQATGLKLQAQNLALQNRKDKERTRQMVNGASELNAALAGQKPQFTLPRFQ